MPHYKALSEDPKPVFDRNVLAEIFYKATIEKRNNDNMFYSWDKLSEEGKENARLGIDAVVAYIEEVLYD